MNVALGNPVKVECAHCGLPAPPPAEDSEPAFCCSGCRGAYQLIRGWGLEEFYHLRDSFGDEITDESSSAFDDLDDPRLLGRSAPLALQTETETPLLQSTLAISGLHCAACIWLIERAPERVRGWHSATVNMHRRTVAITFDPTAIQLSEIALFLARVGYFVSALKDEDSSNEEESNENRALLINVAVAGFCAANAMWIAIALYAGQFSGIASTHAQFLRFAGVGLGVAAVVFPGRIFFRSALASIRTRTPHMDLPVALGLAAGLSASVYALFDPSREVYFDSIACLVFFLLTGRWLQMRGQQRAGEAVSALVRLAPPVATRLEEDGRRSRVPVDQLEVGDSVVVQPSESVPVDGTVTKGESTVDRSLLTGESCPVAVEIGSEVEAGTDNIQSPLTVCVTATGSETRLAAITAAVQQAAETRTPVIQLANRIGAWFVVIVLALAILTGIIWWRVDPGLALNHVVALLIVACPCALALATPLAIAVAIGRLAKRQVLVRSGDCLERLSKPGTVFFDKTGTLTKGRMSVTHFNGSMDVLADVAQIERDVNHPIARAVVEYQLANRDPEHSQPKHPVSSLQQTVGRGVSAWINDRYYEIGSLALLPSGADSLAGPFRQQMEAILATGSSPVVVLRDGECCATFGVMDPLRDDAKEVIDSLSDEGWRVEMISGDHPSAVSRTAELLGIEPELARGGLLPEEKLETIHAAGDQGPVLMVGDGVNDAAALAAADVGIAIRGGARASLAAAPVVIQNGTLRGVLELTRGAKRTRRTIGRNFAASISYNVIAVALAMTGWITPLIAAVLMPISSLTVLGLTLFSDDHSKATS